MISKYLIRYIEIFTDNAISLRNIYYINKEVDNMIGDTIKQLREKNNTTQMELARKLGLSRSAVNAWEMGVSVPSTGYLIQLAKIFSVSTDYILGIDTEEKISIASLKEDEKEIIYALVKYFVKYHYMLSVLHEIGLEQIDEDYEELYNKGFKIPEYLKDGIEHMRKTDRGEIENELLNLKESP